MLKRKLYRAGLLPYRHEGGDIVFLFMRPSDARYGGERFQIAKGKIEEGETPQEAAVREAFEELGLLEGNLSSLDFLGEYLGRTSIYIGAIINPEDFGTPHFETMETRWMTLAEYEEFGRELHVPVIRDALRSIHQRTDK